MQSNSKFFRGLLIGGIAGMYLPEYISSNDSLKNLNRTTRSSEMYNKASDLVAKVLRTFVEPEFAHLVTVKAASVGLGPIEPAPTYDPLLLRTNVFGKTFDNPVGLAAGFDKQGEAMPAILDMGFGFVEVGGVPPLPQPGNPRPRMFRLNEDNAVINRFGLNSVGMDVVKERFQAFVESKPEDCLGRVGVNLAKNTVSQDAVADFQHGVVELGPLSDFLVVNVSCPNVKWTDQYKNAGDGLFNLVMAVKKKRDDMAKENPNVAPVPLLIKIGPDMSREAKESMAKLVLKTGVDGVVVTNTSSQRPDSLQSKHAQEQGGLSGAPVKEQALQTLRDMYTLTRGKVPLVGVGGIASGDDAYERIRAGASLVELYTALVYEGPSLVRRVKTDLAARLEQDGFKTVEEAVGADHRLG